MVCPFMWQVRAPARYACFVCLLFLYTQGDSGGPVFVDEGENFVLTGGVWFGENWVAAFYCFVWWIYNCPGFNKKTLCMFILLIVCKLCFFKIGFRGFFSCFFIATHRGCERRPGKIGKVWGHQQPRALCQVLPDFFVLVICNNCLGSRSSPGGLWRT